VFNMAATGGMSVLGPAAADRTFGRQVWGFVLAAQTAGMVVGAVVAMRLRVRRLLYVGVLCVMGPALVLAALAVSPYATVLIPVAFVAGIGIEQFGIAWETSMQEHIPSDRLARVYSYDALGSFIAIPLGQMLAGPLAQAWGIRSALLAAAGSVVVATAGILFSRDVRHLEHRAASPGTAKPSSAAADPAASPAAVQDLDDHEVGAIENRS
jgi:MFS family permease